MVIILKQHEDVQPNNSERMALPMFLVVGPVTPNNGFSSMAGVFPGPHSRQGLT